MTHRASGSTHGGAVPNLNIRVDDALLASIDALTDEETSRSQVARRLLRQGLNMSIGGKVADPLGKRKHVGPKSSGSPAAKEQMDAIIGGIPAFVDPDAYSASERDRARKELQSESNSDVRKQLQRTCPHPQVSRLGNGQCKVCGAQA
jgi:hypothetical protein